MNHRARAVGLRDALTHDTHALNLLLIHLVLHTSGKMAKESTTTEASRRDHVRDMVPAQGRGLAQRALRRWGIAEQAGNSQAERKITASLTELGKNRSQSCRC